MAIRERTSARGTTVTGADIDALEPLTRVYKMRVGAWLYVVVHPDGRKALEAGWRDKKAKTTVRHRLGHWPYNGGLEAAKQEARTFRTDLLPPSAKPKKDTAEYQRNKRLRQAAKREAAKNLTFNRLALGWPAPGPGL